MKVVSKILMSLTIMLNTHAQTLLQMQVKSSDKQKGVLYTYGYVEEFHHEGSILLQLYKNYTYEYRMTAPHQDVRSFGNWVIQKDTLHISSFLHKNAVPVKIIYSDDTSASASYLNIGAVRTRKGEILDEAFIFINNDSTVCRPVIRECIGTITTIDSLKVEFRNGFSSGWVKVEKERHKTLTLEVQSSLALINSYPLNRKYIISKSSLSKIFEE